MASGPAHYAAAEESLNRAARLREDAVRERDLVYKIEAQGAEDAALPHRRHAARYDTDADTALQEALVHAMLAQAAATASARYSEHNNDTGDSRTFATDGDWNAVLNPKDQT